MESSKKLIILIYSFGILFFVFLGLLIIPSVLGFSPCDMYDNISMSDYFDCRNYFDGLNSTVFVENNFTTFVNNISVQNNNNTVEKIIVYNYSLSFSDVFDDSDFKLLLEGLKNDLRKDIRKEIMDDLDTSQIIKTVVVNESYNILGNQDFLKLREDVEILRFDKMQGKDDGNDFFGDNLVWIGLLGVGGGMFYYTRKKKLEGGFTSFPPQNSFSQPSSNYPTPPEPNPIVKTERDFNGVENL